MQAHSRATGALLLLLALLAPPIKALSLRAVEVPAAAPNASQVTLACRFDLQADQLYSVKWYKNYVEFYRFQPATQSEGPQSSNDNGENDSDQLTGLKREFELDGINLNLAKCNSTHVYLRETSLASEGTYKCEVSADSPSFTTVSMERQMKIYVLPKQKLSIVDNGNPSPPQTGGYLSHLEPAQSSSLSTSQLLGLHVNDILNLTCVSSPSRPPAQLTWFINETPVVPDSKWLSGQVTNGPNSLAESRLTLAFRLQPAHSFRSSEDSDPLPTALPSIPSGSGLLRLRCLAKLVAQFSTETNILVSGGKTSGGQARRATVRSKPPVASFLMAADTWTNSPARATPAQASAQVPNYRWPKQPSVGNGWQTSDHQAADPSIAHVRSASARNLVIWTGRQLKKQTEHIEQVLSQSQANDLDQPTIEAKSLPALSHRVAGGSDESTLTGSDADELGRGDTPINDANQPESRAGGRDFELNELVEFTCKSNVGSPISDQSFKSVRTKWYINDIEISLDRVNFFDGTNFKYIAPVDQDDQSPSKLHRESSKPAVSDLVTNGRPTGPSSSSNRSSNENQRTLLVEFTSSLFQVKELNLKCRTLVEQALIEYETQLLAGLNGGQSGGKFIQVDSAGKSSSGQTRSPVQRNSQNRHHRNRNNHLSRASQSTSSQSSSSSSTRPSMIMACSLWIPLLFLPLLALAQSTTSHIIIRTPIGMGDNFGRRPFR